MPSINRVDIGTLPNDGTGDPLRVAFDKLNQNFSYLANLAPGGPNGSFQFNSDGNLDGSFDFIFDSANSQINMGAALLPTTDATYSLGNTNLRFDSVYLSNSAKIGNVSIFESSAGTISLQTTNPVSDGNMLVGDLVASGNVIVDGSLKFGNVLIDSVIATTPDNSVNQTIFQISATEFKAGTFEIISIQNNSINEQVITLKVSKVSDGTGVRYNAFGTLFTGSTLTTYNVSLSGGYVQIAVSPFINSIITHTINYQIIR